MFYMLALFGLCWWCLTGVYSESLSVTEGDSVILHTFATGIQKDDDILWQFGAEKKSLIAQIRRSEEIFPNERFRDRLKLDRQTGSLTITEITTEQAGDYEVTISGARRSTKLFRISVYAALPVPVLMRNSSQFSSSSSSSMQYCSVVCSVVNVSAVSLSWYKGNSVLSSISVSDLSISLSLPLEVEYQDKHTYSCVINNTISNQTTHLDISHTCSAQGQRLLYFVLVIAAGFLLFATTLAICCICRKSRKTDETGEDTRSNVVLCKPTQKMKKPDAVYQNVPKKR
ncbi:natural killer cell receptor 2B4-like isoform X2 [Danio rerio]|uniref:Natural killer cell receptor 2B4-like isoform X2 n=1 Tax=Danio rerio TaxID=7955 RepID=A0AC58IGE8_DANRE